MVYAGQVVETAPVADFFENPAHPYSRRLLRVATAAHETTPLAGGPAVRERTGGFRPYVLVRAALPNRTSDLP